jgi:hypothetical protein
VVNTLTGLLPEVIDLGVLGHSTVQHSVLDLAGCAELVAFLLNLHRQLSGRRDD